MLIAVNAPEPMLNVAAKHITCVLDLMMFNQILSHRSALSSYSGSLALKNLVGKILKLVQSVFKLGAANRINAPPPQQQQQQQQRVELAMTTCTEICTSLMMAKDQLVDDEVRLQVCKHLTDSELFYLLSGYTTDPQDPQDIQPTKVLDVLRARIGVSTTTTADDSSTTLPPPMRPTLRCVWTISPDFPTDWTLYYNNSNSEQQNQQQLHRLRHAEGSSSNNRSSSRSRSRSIDEQFQQQQSITIQRSQFDRACAVLYPNIAIPDEIGNSAADMPALGLLL
jgi:hypothetical protein